MVIIMKMCPSGNTRNEKLPLLRAFKKYILNIDLSQLNKVDVDENNSTTNTMLTINELYLDPCRKNLKNRNPLTQKI
jgi:lipopolysaccharide export system permease protein